MYIYYKEHDDLGDSQHERIHAILDGEESEPEFNDMDNFVEPEEFQEFIDAFHEEIENHSLQPLSKQPLIAISEILLQFFSNISYNDSQNNLCQRTLSSDSLDFLEQYPKIIDDIIYCLQKLTAVDILRSVIELCQYLSGKSIFFIDYFIEQNGLDYIILRVNILGNEDIILKSIQFLGEISSFKNSHQQLISPELTRNFFPICNSLFSEDRFKKNFNEMVYNSVYLLRSIIGIIMKPVIGDSIPEQQFTQSEMNQQHQQTKMYNTESFIYPGIYKILWNFFTNKKILKTDIFPYAQSEAIEAFMLLYNDSYFIDKVFPQILNLMPKMAELELCSLSNKIKLYHLIFIIYDSECVTNKKTSYIEQIQPNDKNGIPWDLLIDSLSSENKKEVFAAFEVFQALFHYDEISIEIALRKGLNNIFIDMIEGAPFDIKEKALHAVYSWLTCTSTDFYKESFIDYEFIDFLFPLLENPNNPKLNEATFRVILQLKLLCYADEEFQEQINLRIKDVLENNPDLEECF